MELNSDLARKLATHAILSQRREGDTLVLEDEVMLAALDGSRKLTPEQSNALTSSPLTLRRFRQLAMERRQQGRAANDAAWKGSAGMLRAASTAGATGALRTDDGYWTLHVAGEPGDWRLILAMAADAPFAASLLRAATGIKVLDGQGELLLEGELDADGECEAEWLLDAAPFEHLQQAGATFSVKPN